MYKKDGYRQLNVRQLGSLYAPWTIAVNVTWIEREFNACQTHRSNSTSITVPDFHFFHFTLMFHFGFHSLCIHSELLLFSSNSEFFSFNLKLSFHLKFFSFKLEFLFGFKFKLFSFCSCSSFFSFSVMWRDSFTICGNSVVYQPAPVVDLCRRLFPVVTQFAPRRRSVRRTPAGFFLNPVSDESLDPDDHPARICFPQLFSMSSLKTN